MAFSATAGNFQQAWSSETTLTFLRELTIGARMNGMWDGDAMMNDKVFVQNPNYDAVKATKPNRKAAWGTPVEPSASRITIDVDQQGRTEHALYVEDEVINAVRTYRSRLQRVALQALAKQYEDNLVSYMDGLASSGAATVNNNAGPITEIEFKGDKDTGFQPKSGKLHGTDAQQATARTWIEEFLTDARVRLERADIPTESSMNGGIIGGGVSNFWCALPVELYVYGLAAGLEAKGLSLEFTRQIIQRMGVFGSTFAGVYRGFDLFVTNALAASPDHDTKWFAYAGTDQAVAAPRRPVRNYIRTPANASAERYEFRHAHTYGRQLINSQLLIRGKFNAADGVAP